MKSQSIFLLGFILSIFLFCSFIPNKNKPVKLTLHLSPEIRNEDQWIYWFSLYQSEYNIVDSCFVQKGDSICEMSKLLDNNHELTIYFLTCSKDGSAGSALSLLSGENVDVYIKKYNTLFLETKGSVGTEEMYNHFEASSKIRKKINSLSSQLQEVKDSVTAKQLSDSLKFYKEYFNKGMNIELFNKAKHPRTYSLMLAFLSSEITDEESDSLQKVFKARFPNSPTVQGRNVTPSSKATERSKTIHQKYVDLLKGRNFLTSADSKTAQLNVVKRNLKIGDKIDSLSLISFSHKILSLDSIKTPYVLIDFWASWCVPCIREFPNLKNAYNTYNKMLTIYAIAFCNNQEDWKNSVKRYEVDMFSHVYGGSPNSFAGQSLMGRFGVTAIPANFLIDKDRKIIAMNLRGNALEEKMKELTGK